jgi:hypothetical protein
MRLSEIYGQLAYEHKYLPCRKEPAEERCGVLERCPAGDRRGDVACGGEEWPPVEGELERGVLFG